IISFKLIYSYIVLKGVILNISVVIPLYNKEDSVKRTLDSLLYQLDSNDEVIVIDDGSTDNSKSIIKNLFDERVVLIEKENGGVSSARNLGILKSRYNYIALLDADDILLPGAIDTYKSSIEFFPNCSLYCFGYDIVSDKGRRKIKLTTKSRTLSDYEYFILCSKNRNSELTSQSSIVINKNNAVDCGLYKEGVTHSEDIEFCARLVLSGNDVFVSNKLVAEYILTSENRSNSNLKPEVRYIVKSLDVIISDVGSTRLISSLKSYRDKHVIHSLIYQLRYGYFKECKALLLKYDMKNTSYYYTIYKIFIKLFFRLFK
ncbi:glycosyltransferase family 2 protein, partial [Vibrio cyclitrophicus]